MKVNWKEAKGRVFGKKYSGMIEKEATRKIDEKHLMPMKLGVSPVDDEGIDWIDLKFGECSSSVKKRKGKRNRQK